MTLTKKQQTLNAHKKLIEKYRNPLGQKFMSDVDCPLCSIHENLHNGCVGCPMGLGRSGYGCTYFQSYKNVSDCSLYYIKIKEPSTLLLQVFEARAKFHERIIPILESIPAERFTKRGWTYFTELDRSW